MPGGPSLRVRTTLLDTPLGIWAPSLGLGAPLLEERRGSLFALTVEISVRTYPVIALGAFGLAALACGGPESDPRAQETISADAFAQAFFELRNVGLRSPEMEISLEDRDSVLAALGLKEEDLLTFVDVWGDDPEVMEGIWVAVDSLQREERRGPREGQFGEDQDPDPESARRRPTGGQGAP